jgi:GSH-dependent disulfide-bond oxidoreductase
MTLHLHYWPTPNGKKVTIFLEEANLPYEVIPCNIGRGDQFEPQFLEINPNNRMPVLVDDEPLGGGAPISVFESGAILFYLAEKSGRFWPQEPRKKYEVVQWVIWQMANQGPKIGEYPDERRISRRHHCAVDPGFAEFRGQICVVQRCGLRAQANPKTTPAHLDGR